MIAADRSTLWERQNRPTLPTPFEPTPLPRTVAERLARGSEAPPAPGLPPPSRWSRAGAIFLGVLCFATLVIEVLR